MGIAIIDKEIVWRQFGAAIDMFGGALRACPEAQWETRLWEDPPGQWVASGFGAFWYLNYRRGIYRSNRLSADESS